MDENRELADMLVNAEERVTNHARGITVPSAECAPPPPARESVATTVDFSQWQVLPNGNFRPASQTTVAIPAGVYRTAVDHLGPYMSLTRVLSDDVIELPEASHMRVLEGIRKFWGSAEKYHKHGLLYKRGVLLWGPPGGGKTVSVHLLVTEIVTKHNGIVILAEDPALTVVVLRFLRQIEPSRPLIVILEDVDEIVNRHGEHDLLAILDGEHQTDNVVYLATTNYPDRLGARIVNRPSRFDERVKIGMPSAMARRAYLEKATGGAVAPEVIEEWLAKTDGFSIAHLRELVVAVICLEQDGAQVIDRLRTMADRPKEEDGFRLKGHGFRGAAA
jgi:hypothetical protein